MNHEYNFTLLEEKNIHFRQRKKIVLSKTNDILCPNYGVLIVCQFLIFLYIYLFPSVLYE